MKKDLFGYQNQGVNYDIYRPRYPPEMLNKLMLKAKGRNRYIDIATGTGQILFQLCHQFQHSVGLDISQKMISVCEQKIGQKKIERVELHCGDYMSTKVSEKYDLITIGQALHWLPIRQFLIKSKGDLTEGGVLGVFGYILEGVECEDAGFDKKLKELYFEFYDKKVKKNFDFDRDELHTHYSNKERYPFEQIFPNVSRQISKVPIIMDKNGLISYLKTFSGYNTYLQRFSQQEDPIVPIQSQIPQNIKIKCHFDYFSIICML